MIFTDPHHQKHIIDVPAEGIHLLNWVSHHPLGVKYDHTLFVKDGVPHRDGAPAYIKELSPGIAMSLEIDNTTIMKYEVQYRHGEVHSDIGPALVLTQVDGGYYEEYHQYGQFHREEDLPAITFKRPDNTIGYERYYHNGELHRFGNLAEIYYTLSGVIDYERSYQHLGGVKITPEVYNWAKDMGIDLNLPLPEDDRDNFISLLKLSWSDTV